jgi:macrolide transport system ATP-binding/permease protein
MPDLSTPTNHASRKARWVQEVRTRLSSLRLSPTREAEIVEELSQHLDDRWRELMAGGVSADEATRLTLADFRDGDALARYIAPLRQAHPPPSITPGALSGHVLGDLWQDLRYAARMLRKQPGFAATAILTLALGIGANTAIFSLVNATLLRPLPVPDRDRLFYIHRGTGGGAFGFSYPLYEELRDGNGTFEGVAAWGGITASLNAGDTTDLVVGAIVTGNLFDVLGVRADRGRLLTAADDVALGAHPVAVIGHEFWRTRFGGRSDIVGRDVRLNGHVFTIVGVSPAGFPGPQLGSESDVYVPMMMQHIMRPPRGGYSGEENPDLLKNPNNVWLAAIGRLERGVNAEHARAELHTLAKAHWQAVNRLPREATITLVPIDEGNPNLRRQMRSVALLLGAVVCSVLLIGCANLANLLLSRNAARRRELAVRLAIGASRSRVVRQLVTESVFLSAIGGGIGLLFAWVAIRFFEAAPPPPGAVPIAIDFAINQRVLAFSLALSFVTGIVFGAAPALKASRPALVPALKDAAAGGDERSRRLNAKKTLVIAEVALSLLLLLAAGLFIRSLQSAQAIDPGFDVDKLVSAPLNINLLRYTRGQGRDFYRQILERAESLPGVESATVARVALLSGGGRTLGFMVEGGDTTHGANANVIGPGFFKTLGIPLVTGRDFSDRDVDDSPPVVMLNETIVKMHFGGENPVGQRVRLDERGPWREIVGVVRDSKDRSLGAIPLPTAYIPLAQNHETGMTLYVRTSVSPASLVAGIRRAIQELEPNLPVPDIQTMAETIGTSLYAARLGAWLLGAFGGLALVLAAIGIYGVLSFSVSRRTREMGIRLALGAEARDVFLLVVRDGMLLVGAGIMVGLAGALASGRSLASFLYGVSTIDLPTFAGVTVILTSVALVACVIPAFRAMRVNPIAALRYE